VARSATWMLLLALSGCMKGEVGDTQGQTIIHPDLACNSAQEAASNPQCRLTLGIAAQEWIQTTGDQDWWVVNSGAQVDARSIVHVTAGYLPPAGVDAGLFNTAVNLQVNVLDSSGGTVTGSLALGVDAHGSAPPQIIDLTFRYTKPGNDLYVLITDQSGQQVDNVHPYFVKVEVVEDPDTNEPNDVNPTVIPPVPAGQTATQGGYLATPNDVDLFSITSPGAGNVISIRVTQDMSVPSPPPHRFRLEFILTDPNGIPVDDSFASAGSQFDSAQMVTGTARLLAKAGQYILEVRGYKDPNNPTVPIPGDLTFKYKVEIIIVPLQDPSEPNNSIETVMTRGTPDATLGILGSGSITGRISYVPDPDWYWVRLNGDPSGRPHLLHYKVTPNVGAAPRFPAVPGVPERVLSVTTVIQASQISACAAGDPTVCVISASQSNINYPLAVGTCSEPTPQCLQSMRYENQDTPPKFQNLSNFEGVLQIPPHTTAVDYFIEFGAQGDNWADDSDYRIDLDWRAEPDPAETIPDPNRPATLAAGPTGTSLGNGTGRLSFGIGATNTSLFVAPITDPRDYDGRGDDHDQYVITIPAGVGLPLLPDGGVAGQQLFFSWSIPAPAVDQMPYDLGIHFAFCVPDAGVACAELQTTTLSGGSDLGLIYSPQTVTSWWNSGATPLEPAYDRTLSGGAVVTTLRNYACGCLESRLLIPVTGGGTMYVDVFPVNRTSWDTSIPYTIEMGYGPYPQSFVPIGGGASLSCPLPCQFTSN